MIVGTEWLIEASGCDAASLRDESLIRGVLKSVIADLGLKAVGSVWHKFPGEAGVTGMIALTESHLACHTYPEHGIATFNLYCCRSRPEWNWNERLVELLEATNVNVCKIERGSSEVQTATAGGAE
ncbi:MAG TPA: adenosylmethionine decarboxylase [Pyrinomonadaceae bacterium]|nr:adenosylmethionine decarboxylase [Pyrinomonadaceae bacterium]